MFEPFLGQKGGGCRKLNVCTPPAPADTSVNTCKPELTRTSRLIFNLPSRYCSYSRSLRVKHGDVVETQ